MFQNIFNELIFCNEHDKLIKLIKFIESYNESNNFSIYNFSIIIFHLIFNYLISNELLYIASVKIQTENI